MERKTNEITNKIIESIMNFLAKHSIETYEYIKNERASIISLKELRKEFQRIWLQSIEHAYIFLEEFTFDSKYIELEFIKKDFMLWLNKNKDIEIRDIKILQNHTEYIESTILAIEDVYYRIKTAKTEIEIHETLHDAFKNYIKSCVYDKGDEIKWKHYLC